jgi:hypothetical protein
MLTFDDDFSEESDDDQSIESMNDLDSLLPSTSTTDNRNNIRSSKRSSSKTSRKTFEKAAKRFCNNSSSSEDNINKEAVMLLKSLLLSFTDLAKDTYQSSKDIKNLVVSMDKIDKKLNILYENQKKMQRALSKKKVNINFNNNCHI